MSQFENALSLASTAAMETFGSEGGAVLTLTHYGQSIPFWEIEGKTKRDLVSSGFADVSDRLVRCQKSAFQTPVADRQNVTIGANTYFIRTTQTSAGDPEVRLLLARLR